MLSLWSCIILICVLAFLPAEFILQCHGLPQVVSQHLIAVCRASAIPSWKEKPYYQPLNCGSVHQHDLKKTVCVYWSFRSMTWIIFMIPLCPPLFLQASHCAINQPHSELILIKRWGQQCHAIIIIWPPPPPPSDFKCLLTPSRLSSVNLQWSLNYLKITTLFLPGFISLSRLWALFRTCWIP